MASLTFTETRATTSSEQARTTPGVGSGLPTLEEYTSFARRHRWLLLASVCLCLWPAGVWALVQPITYSATASVVLPPVPSYVSTVTSGRLPRDVTIDTDAHLLRSPAVIDAVADSVGEPRDSVPERLRVSAVPLSRVLQLTYTTGPPAAAAQAATTAAEAFVAVREDSLGALQQDQQNQLGLRIAEVQDRLDAEEEQQPFAPPDESLVRELTVLEQRAGQLELLRRTPAEVSRRAVAPTTANPNDVEVPAASGIMMGLLLGCVAGQVVDRRRSGSAVGLLAAGPAPVAVHPPPAHLH